MTTAGRVRVALIGCGRIARVHRAYLENIREAEVVGVFDVDRQSADAFVSGSAIRAFADLGALIDETRPDVAHVLTPPTTHAAVASELLTRSVNVLVEKPLAMSTVEADEVLRAAKAAGVWVSVDHNRYFDPVVQRAAKAVADGRIGELVGVDVFQGAEVGEAEKMLQPSDDWRVNLPGGILHNLASHPLYLMRRFAGPARSIEVLATELAAGRLSEVRLIAAGERCLATVTMSARCRPFMNRLSIYGTNGTIELNLNNMTFIERHTRALPKLVGKVWPNLDESRQLLVATASNTFAYVSGKQRLYPGIGAHLAQLYASLAAGGPPVVSAEEGRDVVAWYDQILAAAGIEHSEGAASVA